MNKQQMTAQQATSFEGFSVANAMILAVTARSKGCNCSAYTDWFTYNRWTAQGFQVQRGEHGIKITTYVTTFADDGNGNKIPSGKFPHNTTVFCRCQVKAKVQA